MRDEGNNNSDVSNSELSAVPLRGKKCPDSSCKLRRKCELASSGSSAAFLLDNSFTSSRSVRSERVWYLILSVCIEDMKISHANVLITLLFYINTAFPEGIEITRFIPKGKGEKWKTVVDSFHIPQSVCYQGRSEYDNYCNTFHTTDGTESYDHCLCSCSKENSTVTYFRNKWRCLENEEVRKQLGCERNPPLFAGEKVHQRLRTLNSDNKRKTRLKNRNDSCTINISSSWYIGCDGKKVSLGWHTNRTTEMFLLQWNSEAYFIEVVDPIDVSVQGRIINLGITCSKPSARFKEGCLLFKLEGSFTCPVGRSTEAIFSSTINPTNSSLEVTSLSTTYLEKASPSLTLGPTQAIRPSSKGKQKNDEGSSSSQLGIIVGVTVSATLVLLLAAVLFICRRRRSRKDTHTSTSGQTNKNTVSRNVKTNSALELEEQNDFATENCKKPSASTYASRYDVPQQQGLLGTLPDQKTISSEGNSHSEGAYATLNIPEGHHIYGPGNAQEPVYNVLEDPEAMFQSYGSGTDQPVYNVLEDLSVRNSGDSGNNGPTEPEPVYNVLEEPYAEGSEEPAWSGAVTVDGPVDNTLEEPNQYDGYPCKNDPVYNVLEAPGLSGSKKADSYDPASFLDPVYNVLEGPEPDKSSGDGLY